MKNIQIFKFCNNLPSVLSDTLKKFLKILVSDNLGILEIFLCERILYFYIYLLILHIDKGMPERPF